jgi:hypothetical protein
MVSKVTLATEISSVFYSTLRLRITKETLWWYMKRKKMGWILSLWLPNEMISSKSWFPWFSKRWQVWFRTRNDDRSRSYKHTQYISFAHGLPVAIHHLYCPNIYAVNASVIKKVFWEIVMNRSDNIQLSIRCSNLRSLNSCFSYTSAFQWNEVMPFFVALWDHTFKPVTDNFDESDISWSIDGIYGWNSKEMIFCR